MGLLCSYVSMAIEPVKEGNVIAGHVIEKGSENSLPYATVLIVETGKGTVTDAEGYFRFKEIPAGEYTLKVQSMGYNTQTKKITVSKDFTVDVNPEKPDVPLNKNDAFQKVQKRRVQEKR